MTNTEWLFANSAKYFGQYVVVLNGKLLAHANQLQELKETPPDAIVVWIYPEEDELWVSILAECEYATPPSDKQ